VDNTAAEVEPILRSLPARMRLDRIEGWGGIFHFVIVGAAKPDWTIEVKDAVCTVEEGLRGDPACVVKMSEKTFIAIETGTKNATFAFVKGKIKVTNVGAMRKYDRAFWKLYEALDAATPPAP